ncbi:MAG: hypothetical protein IH998_11455, partial [Proteobacteria bacterium]|nr:hypothetical protein [Pseudomonadota bacterium]
MNVKLAIKTNAPEPKNAPICNSPPYSAAKIPRSNATSNVPAAATSASGARLRASALCGSVTP